MKKILALAIGMMAMIAPRVMAQISPCGNAAYCGNLASEPGLSYNKTYPIDLTKYAGSRVGAQVVYGSATFNAATFQSGTESTGSVKVISYTQLSTATATNNITILSTTGLSGAVLTIGSTGLRNGFDWFTMNTTSATAISLLGAIQTNIPYLTANSTAAGAVVYTTATVGSLYNGVGFTSNNSSVTVATPTMIGGQDNAVLTINGKTFTANKDYFPATSNTQTATNIATAVNASSATLFLTASGAGAVVTSTSQFNGAQYNYTVTSSTPGALTVNTPTMTGGTNPGYALSSQIFSSGTATGLTLGLPVLYTVGSASAIGGLTTGTTYYAVPVNSSQFELALYSTSAVAGLTTDFVTVTSTNSGLTQQTYTVTPTTTTGASSFVWETSNDNSNWTTVLTTGTITPVYARPYTQKLFDFGAFNFRWLRLNVTAPASSGGLYLQVPVYIKQDGIGPF